MLLDDSARRVRKGEWPASESTKEKGISEKGGPGMRSKEVALGEQKTKIDRRESSKKHK